MIWKSRRRPICCAVRATSLGLMFLMLFVLSVLACVCDAAYQSNHPHPDWATSQWTPPRGWRPPNFPRNVVPVETMSSGRAQAYADLSLEWRQVNDGRPPPGHEGHPPPPPHFYPRHHHEHDQQQQPEPRHEQPPPPRSTSYEDFLDREWSAFRAEVDQFRVGEDHMQQPPPSEQQYQQQRQQRPPHPNPGEHQSPHLRDFSFQERFDQRVNQVHHNHRPDPYKPQPPPPQQHRRQSSYTAHNVRQPSPFGPQYQQQQYHHQYAAEARAQPSQESVSFYERQQQYRASRNTYQQQQHHTGIPQAQNWAAPHRANSYYAGGGWAGQQQSDIPQAQRWAQAANVGRNGVPQARRWTQEYPSYSTPYQNAQRTHPHQQQRQPRVTVANEWWEHSKTDPYAPRGAAQQPSNSRWKPFDPLTATDPQQTRSSNQNSETTRQRVQEPVGVGYNSNPYDSRDAASQQPSPFETNHFSRGAYKATNGARAAPGRPDPPPQPFADGRHPFGQYPDGPPPPEGFQGDEPQHHQGFPGPDFGPPPNMPGSHPDPASNVYDPATRGANGYSPNYEQHRGYQPRQGRKHVFRKKTQAPANDHRHHNPAASSHHQHRPNPYAMATSSRRQWNGPPNNNRNQRYARNHVESVYFDASETNSFFRHPHTRPSRPNFMDAFQNSGSSSWNQQSTNASNQEPSTPKQRTDYSTGTEVTIDITPVEETEPVERSAETRRRAKPFRTVDDLFESVTSSPPEEETTAAPSARVESNATESEVGSSSPVAKSEKAEAAEDPLGFDLAAIWARINGGNDKAEPSNSRSDLPGYLKKETTVASGLEGKRTPSKTVPVEEQETVVEPILVTDPKVSSVGKNQDTLEVIELRKRSGDDHADWEAPEKCMASSTIVEPSARSDEELGDLEMPWWWEEPSGQRKDDCESLRSLLNEDHFRGELKRLAETALRDESSSNEVWRIERTQVASVGAAGVVVRAWVLDTPQSTRPRVVGISIPFTKSVSSYQELQTTVLELVSAAIDP